MKSFCRIWGLIGTLFLSLSLFGQESGGQSYRLSSGDQVAISVFGEGDLGIAQRIDEMGKVVMPLLGEVMLDGLTVREAETMIEKRFKDEDFLVKPEVTVQVTGSKVRNFYVFGEVRSSGVKQFPPNRSSISIIEAIAMAGDFTQFAKSNAVQVTRRLENGKEIVFKIDVRRLQQGGTTEDGEMVDILPGDMITVPEGMF